MGPVGSQVVVIVLQLDEPALRWTEANASLRRQIRSAVAQQYSPDIDVAAVLLAPSIPVDQRHNSKIDRRFIAQQAAIQLAGR